MFAELSAVPELLHQQIPKHGVILCQLLKQIRSRSIQHILLVARGSSYHVAMFAKYIIEIELGIPCTFCPPAMVTCYQTLPLSDDTLMIAISQSGQSDDLCAVMAQAKEQGALTLAIVNRTNARLAKLVDLVYPVLAGREVAVAATKTVLLSMAAVIHLVAVWQNNRILHQHLTDLPKSLSAFTPYQVPAIAKTLAAYEQGFCLGRGLSFSLALEAALKFKETCHMCM